MEKKKPYRKPEIKRVEMTPEDAVLTACKHGDAGPNKALWCNNKKVRCQNRMQGS